jgi:hypothetical protein
VLPRRRPRLTPREFGLLVGAVLIGACVLTGLTVANIRWSMFVPGGGSFYTIWVGSREFIFQHGDPYGQAVAVQAQQLAHGDADIPKSDPLRLNLPFFLLPFFFPLAMISDPVIARGVWATIAELALVMATVLYVRTVEWKPPRKLLLGIGLMAFLAYPTVYALVEGSPVVLLPLLYFAILWATQNESDELAGALAALALWKWEVGFPFLLLLALHTSRARRWRLVAGLGMALTVLLTASFIIFPGWPMPFLIGSVAVLRSQPGSSALSALRQLVPASMPGIGFALTAVTVVVLIAESVGAQRSDSRRFAWAASLVLTGTPLLGMRSEIASLVLLLPGLAMIAAGGAHRRRYGGWLSILLLTLILAVPWVLASPMLNLPAPKRDALVFLATPLACVMGMYWTRWWFLRPPRTWLDEIREPR